MYLDKINSFFSDVRFNKETPLCSLMSKYGSDKSGHHHNYTKFYDYIFSDIRNNKLNFFELGLGTNNPNIACSMGIDGKPGASLRAWRDYFINSNIYGADIDKDILFEEDRIKTFFVDQTNSSTITDLFDRQLADLEFDVIIDDGLHKFDANVNFLITCIHKLKQGGIFIIEDLNARTLSSFQNNLDKDIFRGNFIKNARIIQIPLATNPEDNNLVVFLK